jgi:hypothetical protein
MKTMRSFARPLARPVIASLLLAVLLTLGGCGPIMEFVLCHDQKDDCSTQKSS